MPLGKRTRSDAEPSQAISPKCLFWSEDDSPRRVPVDGSLSTSEVCSEPDRQGDEQPTTDADDAYPAFVVSCQSPEKQISVADLRELVLYVLGDGTAPRWLAVRNKANISKVVVVLVPGLDPSLFDMQFVRREELVAPIALTSKNVPPPLSVLPSIFSHIWPIKAPGERGRLFSPIAAMLNVPLTKQEKRELVAAKARESRMNNRLPLGSLFMTVQQLSEQQYPLHFSQGGDELPPGWAETRKAQDAIGDGDIDGMKILALDCEMCLTANGSELTRVTLVNYSGEILYDALVKPAAPITNYLTQYSGMTEERLQDVTTTLSDVQAKLSTLLDFHTVLVGHSLESDLLALRYRHPHIIDTSIIYHHTRGPPYRPSLKWLARKFLSQEIQKSALGHDSIEDAKTCLCLLKMKLANGPLFGLAENLSTPIFRRLQQGPATVRTGYIDYANAGYGAAADVQETCETDDQVISKVQQALESCQFIWARLREIEKGRGWVTEHAKAEADGSSDIKTGITSIESSPIETTSYLVSANQRIQQLWTSLPARTALIIFSGSGDPREMARLNRQKQDFQREYLTKNWEFIENKWTDDEVQLLNDAVDRARAGVAFLAVK